MFSVVYVRNKVYRLEFTKIVRSKTNSRFQAKALRQEVSGGFCAQKYRR